MKLDVVSTLKEGLQLLKENPKILVPLAVSVVLWLLVVVASYGILGLEYYDTAELLNALVLLLLVWTVVGTLGYFLDNVAVRVAADVALSGETYLKDGLLFTLRKLPTLLAAGFIYMLIVTPASLLIVPGIYLGVRLLFFSYAILIDNESAMGSLKKSWSIVKGNWLRTFALLAVFAVIGFPLGYLLEIENLLLWAVACAGMVLVRGWAIATLTLAYLQLAPEPAEEEEEEEEEYLTMPPEEPFELQQKIDEPEIPLKPKPEIERKPRKDEDEEIKEEQKQKKVLDEFLLSEEISPENSVESESGITMQQLQTERRDEEKEKQSEEIEKEEGDVRIADSAERNVKVSEIDVIANTVAEETTDKVRIEGLGLRRRRLQKSDTKHVDKNVPQKVDKAEQKSRGNTKDVEESSLDGVSVVLRRD